MIEIVPLRAKVMRHGKLIPPLHQAPQLRASADLHGYAALPKAMQLMIDDCADGTYEGLPDKCTEDGECCDREHYDFEIVEKQLDELVVMIKGPRSKWKRKALLKIIGILEDELGFDG